MWMLLRSGAGRALLALAAMAVVGVFAGVAALVGLLMSSGPASFGASGPSTTCVVVDNSEPTDPDGADLSELCQLPGGVQQAAAMLLDLEQQGRVVFYAPLHHAQVVALALDSPNPECLIDARVLLLVLVAAHEFERVGVSHFSRLCTGEILGAGVNSLHYRSPALAVDFIMLDGVALTGADPKSLQFIHKLAHILPTGSAIGQSDCRADARVSVRLPLGIVQFADTCHHLHVQVPVEPTPLNLGG